MKRSQIAFFIIGLAIIIISAFFSNRWFLALAPTFYFLIGGPVYSVFMPENELTKSNEPFLMFTTGVIIGVFWLFVAIPTLVITGLIAPF